MKHLVIILSLCLTFTKVISQNPFLVDAGFESLPTGANTSTAWISSSASSLGGNNISCGGSSVWTATNVTAVVATTPISDPRCMHVANSPFSGNKVMVLNKTAPGTGSNTRARLKQTFQVSNNAFIYRYAYKAVLDGLSSLWCDAGCLVFNFYDCSNNLISALSRTVIPTTGGNNPDASSWSLSPPTNAGAYNNYGLAYTPNWVLHSANLMPYIGSCITVEVIVSPCVCGAWEGYCYYDSECNNNIIETSGATFPGAISYSTCGTSGYLSGTPGFSTYLWQGPANSGISGATSAAITASVSGNYSLSVSSGTFNMTNVINLALVNQPTVGITQSSATVCLGGTVTLLASGTALNSYTWTNSSVSNSISVSPTISTTYYVFANNTLGCLASDSKLVAVVPSPQLVQISSNASSICLGQNVTFNAVGSANTSYTWSTGSNNSSLTVSPNASTSYIVSATNTLGCVSSATAVVNVNGSTPIQINLSNPSVCANQSASLTLVNQAISSYTWGNGTSNQALIVTPAQTSIYSVTGTNIYGCISSASVTLNVLPLPSLQVSASSTAICSGQVVTVSATSSGSVFNWNNGSVFSNFTESPATNMVYQVTVTNANGCVSTGSIGVTVRPLPQVSIIAPDQICQGASLTLSTTLPNMATYVWSTGGTGQSINVTPSGAAIYSVSVTDNFGCSANAQKFVDVTECTGIPNNSATMNSIQVFPNPTQSEFVVKSYKDESGVIFNAKGQTIKTFQLSAENDHSQKFENFAPGIYFIHTGGITSKLIVR